MRGARRPAEAGSSGAGKALATRQVLEATGRMARFPLMTSTAILCAYRACTTCVTYVSADQAVLPEMQATMVVADAKESLTITGNGDVVEPHDGVVGALSSVADL